uniref:Uncharacterized protein n=1 Tax=Acrobeloides nanus TaxID=290746 RepID=A0A914C111_9BILA
MSNPQQNSRPDFEYVHDRPAVEIDLDATLKEVVNEHSAGLDFEEHDYQNQVPRGEPTTVEEEIHRAILPDARRKMLNLRYLTRLRGLVKFSQLIFMCGFYGAIAYSSDYLHYPEQKSTYYLLPFAITFTILIINGYMAFPHLTIKDQATRNGMLFSELLLCFLSTIYLLGNAPIRVLQLLFAHFDFVSMFILICLQAPLTLILIYDLVGCIGEWTLSGMRPLGQRPNANGNNASNTTTNYGAAHTNPNFEHTQ